ncbi:MAG: ferrochelatase [Betaproteobacteria bacterium]
MSYLPEPPHAHDRPAKLGVLLVNLGTPDAPTPSAVRRYLAEFLADRRVVEIPAALWKPILYGAILPLRPSRSARRYAAIWSKEGSPLAVHSVRQRVLLLGMLGQRMKREGLPADHAQVELGMRYGGPSIASAIDKLRAAGSTKILVLPLYPQYAASTTARALDAVAAHVAKLRRAPAIRFVDGFHDDIGYIKASAQVVNDYWMKHGRPQRLILSFHGVPRRTLELGDPYHCECHVTARLLAQELGLASDQWQIAFQSRFGKAEWLKPYTLATVRSLGAGKVPRVDVFCPGFVSDCLETLEEIGIENAMAFRDAGGGELHAIPCLNEHPRWIAALAELAWQHLQGWLAPVPDARERELTLARAKTLGAKR